MALWQYDVYLIPEKILQEKFGTIPTQLDMDEHEPLDTDWWLPLGVRFKQLLPLLEKFGPVQDWTAEMDGLRHFGDDEVHDISVTFTDSGIIDGLVHCRLSLYDLTEDDVVRILELAEQYHCMLMDVKGHLFKPEVPTFLQSMESSNAARFVEGGQLQNGHARPE